MINNLTGKKMDDTYLMSKDGKSYIFDIRRPSTLSNIETYDDKDASFKGLETRTGLGDRVLRRVNFIKPTIKPRTVSEGKLSLSTGAKTIEQIMKEGIKIKYEELDPWDTKWLDEKNKIVKRMRDGGESEERIQESLERYPPLNRKQRTRPVSRNPFEDANKPINEQLVNLGINVIGVTAQVADNAEKANKIAVEQANERTLLQKWTETQMGIIEGIMKSGISNQDIMALKLEQVVTQLSLQQSTMNSLLMTAVQNSDLDTDLFTSANMAEIEADAKIKLYLMKIIQDYYPTELSDISNIKIEMGNEMVSLNIGYAMMTRNSNLYIVNNSKLNPKTLSFEYSATPQIPFTEEQQNKLIASDMSTIGSIPSEISEAVKPVIPVIPPTPYLPSITDDKDVNIQRIIDVLQVGFWTIAEDVKYKDILDTILKQGVIANTDLRILKIHVNYELIKVQDKDKTITDYKLTKPPFLDVELISGLDASYKKVGLFNYTYEPKTGFVYFVIPKQMASQYAGPQIDTLKAFIKEELDKTRKIQANVFKDMALASSVEADKSLKAAEANVIKANEKVGLIKELVDKLNKAIEDNKTKAAKIIAYKIASDLLAQNELIKQNLEEERKKNDDIEVKKVIDDLIQKTIDNNTILDDAVGNDGNIDPTAVVTIVPNVIETIATLDDQILALQNKASEPSKPKSSDVMSNNDDDGKLIHKINVLANDDKWKHILEGDGINDGSKVIVLMKEDNKYIIKDNVTKQNYTADKVKLYGGIADIPLLGDNIKKTKIRDGIEYKYIITIVNGVSKQKGKAFIDAINAIPDPPSGSGIRAFHKKNINPIYKNSMEDIKGKGLKLAGKGRKENPWLVHVKKFRASHPNLKYSDVLKQAKSTYKK